ncbi:YdbL family protein [Novosphingobium sp. BW1]|uniref:YdbL family protein n=1 Tax=Novosphingobium sp. BW1 TaxID=2592621 RepID=UPI0011DECF9C|nr:YdbL family protein [Novosphingobium sp. BW1]TYC92795.1 DUF1318 domain-containing protein [Novosphingobium sp. BW1]
MRSLIEKPVAATALALAMLVGLGMVAPAGAQSRGEAYSAAKAQGQVGEQRNGYLGVVGNQSADVRSMVRDINNKRRAIYTSKAASLSSTIDEYAFTTACRLITETSPGEKYEGLDGSWKTRGAGAPERDPKCP